jgi:hypothetical protein
VSSSAHRPPTLLGVVATAALAGACLVIATHVGLNVFPQTGARGVEILRHIVGQRAVAQLEMGALRGEDAVRRVLFRIRPEQRQRVWTRTAKSEHQAAPHGSPAGWPAPAHALGNAPGEGAWEPYSRGVSGRVVAARTLIQPDPERPYAFAAVVAFDLRATRLHFVLGSDEPKSPVVLPRPGRIPAADFSASKLLAAFNGGFKAEHGHFGAMVHGTVVLPPRDGLGTVAIDEDGHVRMGVWGSEIFPSPEIETWRQNGPLLVDHREINPRVDVDDPEDWGITVGHGTATWRSALALSEDGETLYYFAGPSLTLRALARAVVATGAFTALQIDINNYWVHFDWFRAGTGHRKVEAVPLLDAMRKKSDSRYVVGFIRDFFYVTVAPAERASD